MFEREDRIGGLLMYGIPNMKLDKEEVVQRRVNLLAEEGIVFKTGIDIGKDAEWTAEKLRKDFDAIVLCCGATLGRDLPIEDRDAKGVHLAMEFLTDNTRYQLDHQFDGTNPALNATGKDVVVIGGGDTGTDCVGTSLRHGCKSVIQLEIMPQPPMERAAEQPVARVAEGLQDGLRPGRSRRRPRPGPAPVSGADQAFPQGRRRQSHRPRNLRHRVGRTTKAASCPRKKKAAPASSPRNSRCSPWASSDPSRTSSKQFALETDARSNVKAEHGTFTTNLPGVFAAGDMRRGQSLVVWAINEGRGAARECDRFLMGVTHLALTK